MTDELARSRRRTRIILYAAVTLQMVAWGHTFMTLPFHAVERFDANYRDLGLVAFIPPLIYVLPAMLFGRLADRINRRVLAGCGIAVFGLAIMAVRFAPNLPVMIALLGLAWVGMAAFWPPMQADLAETAPAAERSRVTGTFNIVWSFSLIPGLLLAGFISSRFSFVACFLTVACFSCAAAVVQLFAWRKGKRGKETSEPPTPSAAEASGERRDAALSTRCREVFRYSALLTNLTAAGGYTTLRFFFSKIAKQEGYDDFLANLPYAVMSLALTAAFVLFAVWRSWRYRIWPLAASPLLLLCGALLMIFGGSPPAYGAAVGAVGFADGPSYAASIFYSVDAPGPVGRRTGVHEGCMSFGMGFIPFLGGAIAEWLSWGRTPYVLVAGLSLLLLAMLFLWTARVRRRENAEERGAV